MYPKQTNRLSKRERAVAAESALGSVRAEGLDPSGIEAGLHAWVIGELTINELVQSELASTSEKYGQPDLVDSASTAMRPCSKLIWRQ